ncbi:hypothetical protein, partial [Alicyclobacillus suci]|uniref:hypothetical protein n=1 Tax=Alicyclobacillus suci TaxID=2816080 RepID=UPI001A8C88A9
FACSAQNPYTLFRQLAREILATIRFMVHSADPNYHKIFAKQKILHFIYLSVLQFYKLPQGKGSKGMKKDFTPTFEKISSDQARNFRERKSHLYILQPSPFPLRTG